jgi:hypothetical protein
MNRMLVPPREPGAEPVRPPMIYIEKKMKWEYKQIIRDLDKESPMDEAELNKLGEEGWEMSGVAQQPPLAYYYFKRLTEK